MKAERLQAELHWKNAEAIQGASCLEPYPLAYFS